MLLLNATTLMSSSICLNVSIHCAQHLDELNYQLNWREHFWLIHDFCQKGRVKADRVDSKHRFFS